MICGEGRIDANWIADELKHVYNQGEDVPDEDEGILEDADEDFAVSDFDSSEPEAGEDSNENLPADVQDQPAVSV